MKFLMRSSSLAVLALVVTGCSTPPPVPLKPGDLPAGFTAPATPEMATAPVWPTADWWNGFNAPELPALEKTAQVENLDLLAAAAVVLQAHANTGIAGSALFPSLSASGQAQRSGTKINGLSGTGEGHEQHLRHRRAGEL
ncbi:MAG: TolC family protein [Rhizomicrobium sp.]